MQNFRGMLCSGMVFLYVTLLIGWAYCLMPDVAMRLPVRVIWAMIALVMPMDCVARISDKLEWFFEEYETLGKYLSTSRFLLSAC